MLKKQRNARSRPPLPRRPIAYYGWPYIRRMFYNIHVELWHTFKHKRPSLAPMVFIISLAALLGGLVLFIRVNMLVVPAREGYDMTGFVAAADLAGDVHVLSNHRFRFHFNEVDTHFIIEDTTTNQLWRSNISEPDPFPGLTLSSRQRQQNTLVVHYQDQSGVSRAIHNFHLSIERNQFSVRYGSNTIEVHYWIGDMEIDHTDLPQRLSRSRFETLILAYLDEETQRLDRRFLETSYIFVPEHDLYTLRNPENLSQNAVERLYRTIFEETAYTFEDMVADHLEHDVEVRDNKPLIGITLRYTLTETGFDVTLVNESISEKLGLPLVSVDVLPNFGEAGIQHEGYLFVPDGSGALIDLNNGRSIREYNQRLYGPDHAIIPASLPTQQALTALPVFGMKRDENAFIAIVTQGASMATVRARVSGASDSYNRVFTTFHYKERDRVRIPGVTSLDQSSLFRTVWTRLYSTADYALSYRFTTPGKGDYVGMAHLFRDYLTEQGVRDRNPSDSVQMNVTMLGGFVQQNHFLGIPYNTVEALTSMDDVKMLIDKLNAEGVTGLNIIYQGWMNGGIDGYLPTQIDYHNNIGSYRDMVALLNYATARNVRLYPEVNMMLVYSDKYLNPREDVARTIYGNVTKIYRFNPATLLPNRETTPRYFLNPAALDDVVTSFINAYQPLETPRLALEDLGSVSGGSYSSQAMLFRYDSQQHIDVAMSRIDDAFGDLLFRNPLADALPYASRIIDLPVSSTEFLIIDRSIPFYQMALSGLIDYAGQPFNLYDTQTTAWHLLKAMETGSHLNFTWSYQDTFGLMHTEYNRFYSTHYQNWFDEAVEMYRILEPLSMYGQVLINHRFIEQDVVQVTYANGLSLLLNYRNAPYLHEGNLIPAMGHYIAKEAD